MDLKKLVALAIRLAGLWLVVSTILEAAAAVPIVLQSMETVAVPYLVPIALSLLLGLLCWFLPVPIANTIVKGESLVQDKGRVFPEIERIAIVVLGLYLLYRGLADLAYHYAYEAAYADLFASQRIRGVEGNARLISAFVEIGVSIAFVFGARPLVLALQRFWRWGRRWPAVS